MEYILRKCEDTGMIVIDDQRKIIYANNWVIENFGDDYNQIFGKYLNCQMDKVLEQIDFTSEHACKTCIINETIEDVKLTGKSIILEGVTVKKNNLDLDIDVTMKFSKLANTVLIELLNLDVQIFKVDFLMKMADKSKDIMFFKDAQARYLYVNKTYADFCGKSPGYLIGKTDEILVELGILPSEIYEQCLNGDRITYEQGYYHDVETMGEQYFRISKERIDGGILGVARDITEEVQAMKQAETDELTKVNSRYKFEKDIKVVYEKQEPYDLAIIDVDDLRILNNTYGHLKGDTYLKILCRIFMNQTDTRFYRVGGDEFIALISHQNTDALTVFTQIKAEIEALQLNPKLSISVGIGTLDFSQSYDDNYDR
ncbi:MAG: diguanylate cyclase, partial [Culicoidibacterales bacterium]